MDDTHVEVTEGMYNWPDRCETITDMLAEASRNNGYPWTWDECSGHYRRWNYYSPEQGYWYIA